MKIVIAPDSFKESIPAAHVAAALAEGVLSAQPDARVDLCPMADGGEGTVAAMVAATGGSHEAADVFDPLGRPIRARWGTLGNPVGAGLPGLVGLLGAMDQTQGGGESAAPDARRVAVIEMAAASGLALVAPDLRDPLRATSYGTGQLILAALDAGAEEIIVGVGGSATCDGGAGCAQALGVLFADASGQPCVCGLAAGALEEITGIDLSGRDPRLDDVRIRVACDVNNPLLGPDGAARVYAPQKGATPEQVEQIESGLAHLAGLIARDCGIDVADLPGGGAAGGLAAGLVALVGAEVEPGAELVARAVRLPARLAGADLCITGEGRLDASSEFGKTAVAVADLARAAGVPTVCIAGSVSEDAPVDAFAHVLSLVDEDTPSASTMSQPDQYLRARAAEALRSMRV